MVLEDLCVCMITCRWIFLGMKNFSDEICRENQNTHFLCSVTPPPLRKSCRLWDNVEKNCGAGLASDDNTTQRMRVSYWMIKTTNTQIWYVCVCPCIIYENDERNQLDVCIQLDTNLHTVHSTTHRLLRTSATTPSAEHHIVLLKKGIYMPETCRVIEDNK
jgi:hypothetical protein